MSCECKKEAGTASCTCEAQTGSLPQCRCKELGRGWECPRCAQIWAPVVLRCTCNVEPKISQADRTLGRFLNHPC